MKTNEITKVSSKPEITMIPVSKLIANDYNPNRMTDAKSL